MEQYTPGFTATFKCSCHNLHCVLAIPLSGMKNKAFVQIVTERDWCIIWSCQSFQHDSSAFSQNIFYKEMDYIAVNLLFATTGYWL